MPLSLHSGKNIFMGNNALQEMHFENNRVSFSFSSVSHRLVTACRHRGISLQWQYNKCIEIHNQEKDTYIDLWSYRVAALSASLSFFHAQHQELQHSSGSQGNRIATTSFQDVLTSVLQVSNLLEHSMCFGISLPLFMSTFHRLHSALFSPSSASSLPHLHIQVCLGVQCFCVYSSLLICFVSHICFQLWPLKSRRRAALLSAGRGTVSHGTGWHWDKLCCPLQWGGSQGVQAPPDCSMGTAYLHSVVHLCTKMWLTGICTQKQRCCRVT